MTKQEEIRNGLIDILDTTENPYTDEDNRPRGYVDKILEYLHSQGVAIKVDIEVAPKGSPIRVCEYFEPLIEE